ncbi:MAG: hypothetical protein B6D41_08365 [Chloroflexi bacterium UTCFX4]|nr:MAG: hypothetical protein B6D41_08365 [Chloroflexi bacterium UTCFX4]
MLCMEFIEIPSGVLWMGDKRLRDAAPAHQLELRAFAIGKYPVTNAEYAEFISARGYENETYWTALGWKWMRGRIGQTALPGFWNEPRLNRARYPVVGVSWHEAVAFCNWLSTQSDARYCLPSEAEWEYAARGPNNARDFPWGEKFERGRANTAEAEFGGTTPVTHFPAGVSPFGVWDLAGNVFEWTLSKWGNNWQTLEFAYPYRADDGREEIEGGGARVMRGGAWFNPYHEASCAYRSRYLAGSRGSNIGFRVVKQRLETED